MADADDITETPEEKAERLKKEKAEKKAAADRVNAEATREKEFAALKLRAKELEAKVTDGENKSLLDKLNADFLAFTEKHKETVTPPAKKSFLETLLDPDSWFK